MDVLVTENLTCECNADDQCQPVEASCESVQLQAFLAGQVDVLLVREQQGSSGAGLAHGVRVKDELEG
jgi:3-deoxy-D-manno-octulosonic acid (KDO) 8-phosphate synthase